MIEEGDFLGRLEGVQRSGDGWVARCPAHGDDNPSLSVSRGHDGRWLVHCHAGCSAEAVVEAMGLKLRDLMPDNPDWRPAHAPAPSPSRAPAPPTSHASGGSAKRGLGKWICDYDYQDEQGRVIYKASRYLREDGNKTFVLKTPDPLAPYGWSFGLSKSNVPRVPYHLPRVIEAAKAGRTIVVVEGEKDADNLAAATGCASTCNVAGAMKWGYRFPEDWVRWFQGARGVIVVADDDPRTKTVRKSRRGVTTVEEIEHWRGQKHAWDVRCQLVAAGFAGKIKLMTMPQVEGQGHVKDFTDWLEARKAAGLPADRAAFLEAIETAAPWPTEWEFANEALEASRGEDPRTRSTPVPASTDVVSAEKGGDEAFPPTADPANGEGRFGRPRAPGAARDGWEVDFDLGGGRSARVELDAGWTVQSCFATMYAQVARNCPNNELPKGMAPRIKSWSATLWLLMRGSFFWNSDFRDFATAMYLDRDPESCTLMRIMSDEFYAFVAEHAHLEDVDPKKGDLAKIMGLVKQLAVNGEYSTGTRPGNSWERRGDAIYISSGDTEMCRIRGGKVEFVQNGTDGVVFLRGKTLAPWRLVDGDGVDPFATAKIFTGASWADAAGAMNVRLWVMNLLACHATKPPLLITGGAGSGKTRMAKAVKEILGMRQDGALDLSVQQIEDGDKGLDAFWATVNDGKLEVFDNFDTKVKWASDTLQTAATDGQTKRRTLYTTYGVSILRANASIILTSNNPVFSTEGNGGLADRLVTVRLTMNRGGSQDAELSADIARNRNAYLTWMSRTLAKVLEDHAPVDAAVNRRHPDYGEFSVRVGRAIGDEEGAVRALGAAEADKAILPLMNDVVTREIMEALRDRDWRWAGTAGEMAKIIMDRMGEDADEKTKQIYSSRRIGKALSKYQRQFSLVLKMADPRLKDGCTRYQFDGPTALSGLASGFGSGKVGFEGTSGKLPQAHALVRVTGNGVCNPLAPAKPTSAGCGDGYARARSPAPPFEEEEDMRKRGNPPGDLGDAAGASPSEEDLFGPSDDGGLEWDL